MAKKNNPLSDVFGFVQKAATDAVNAAGNIGESVKDGIVSAANSVGSAVNDAANRVTSQTVKIADLNGDGKLDQEDISLPPMGKVASAKNACIVLPKTDEVLDCGTPQLSVEARSKM